MTTPPVYTQATGSSNPFSGVDVGSSSKPTFVDIDSDGDLDLVVGDKDGTLIYYKNIGSLTLPSYVEQAGTINPFNGIDAGLLSAPAFSDINGDGLIDLVVGTAWGSDVHYGLHYYQNGGSAGAPIFREVTGTDNPFDTYLGNYTTPNLADIYGHGFPDLIFGECGGRWNATLRFVANIGTASSPVWSKDQPNPFAQINANQQLDSRSAPSFGDINDDGLLDMVVGGRNGLINYFENTGSTSSPAFTQVSGSENPFNGIDVGLFSGPAFADINGDGRPELIVGGTDGTLTAYVTCFLAGTLIATPAGERPIESLQPGDLISTAAGPQPVRFISRTSHLAPLLDANDVLPIRIAAGALGARGPVRDLYVSPDHAILIDGHLLQASVLVNGSTITRTSLAHWQQRHNEPIEYLNIELERHQLITAEGLVVESFVDNLPRCDWDNYTAYLTLYHQELPIQELPLPRVKFKRQLPIALRQLLQQLAESPLPQASRQALAQRLAVGV